MDTAAFDHWERKDDALCYVKNFMFERLHSMVLKWNLYSEGEYRSEMLHYAPESGQLPQVFENLPDIVVAVFKASRPSPPRPSIIELDENGMPVNQPTKQGHSVTSVYTSRDILHSEVNRRIVWRPTQARALKRSQSSTSSRMMDGAVQKCQQAIGEMLGADGPATKEAEGKEEDLLMEMADVMEQAAS